MNITMKATISYLSPRFKFVPKGDFDSQSCLIMEYPETATGEKGKENKKITIFEKTSLKAFSHQRRAKSFNTLRNKADSFEKSHF